MGLSVEKPTCVMRPCCGVMADVHYSADSGGGEIVLQRCISSSISSAMLTNVQARHDNHYTVFFLGGEIKLESHSETDRDWYS